jgi:hypothetical protein
MSPQKKVLPICRPSVLTYLYHANYLSIVELHPEAKHFLVNHFVQLHTRANNTPGMVMFDFYSYEGKRPRYPFLTKATISAHTWNSLGGDVIDKACSILDSGCYLEPALDEYYVSNKLAYQSFHLPHENLIYGYSKDDQVFMVQGYTKNFDFTRFTLPFEEFRKAFTEEIWMSVLDPKDSVDLNARPFSPDLIKTYLVDYLEERTSFPSYRPSGSLFGKAVYPLAIERLLRYNGRSIDVRPWCIFAEHKAKLLGLHDYLVSERKVTVDHRVGDGLRQLARDFVEVKNYIVEASFLGKEVQARSIRNNLGTALEPENELIMRLIDAVDASR